MTAGAVAGAAAAALTTPLDVCKTLLNTQEDGVGKTRGLVQAIKKVYKAAGIGGFFKGMQPRVLYQMPATAICWTTYEFFKYLLNRTEKVKPTPVDGPGPALVVPKLHATTAADDSKSSSRLHYVLPVTAAAVSAETSGAPEVPSTSLPGLKPRELPAMSGAGMYGSLSFNTMHSSDSASIKDISGRRSGA